jgi:hypothetical protein
MFQRVRYIFSNAYIPGNLSNLKYIYTQLLNQLQIRVKECLKDGIEDLLAHKHTEKKPNGNNIIRWRKISYSQDPLSIKLTELEVVCRASTERKGEKRSN